MIVCHIVPVLRAVRRVVAVRPRPVVKAAIGATIRRAPRPMITVCRDAGLAGLLLATAAAAPLPDPITPTAAEAAIEGRYGIERQAAAGEAIAPLWAGTWGGFPPPADPSPRTDPMPGRAGDMPLPLLTGSTPTDQAAVPEPSSLALFAIGLIAAPLVRRRYGR